MGLLVLMQMAGEEFSSQRISQLLHGQNLRSSLATFAQKACTSEIETTKKDGKYLTNLEAYLACRQIPLDKIQESDLLE